MGGLSQVFKASDWPNSNLVGGCVGGLSQVFKASDWPNSNVGGCNWRVAN